MVKEVKQAEVIHLLPTKSRLALSSLQNCAADISSYSISVSLTEPKMPT